jgi:XTP/dITP diphosphohydrolase
MELLFGTTNPGKLRELRRLVAELPIRVLSPDDLGRPLPEVEEDGATFEENAAKKAVEWARRAGLHAVADDSGLCVDALGGAPGVWSARWSEEVRPGALPRAARDEANNDLLLARLAGRPDEERGAEYRAVLVLAAPAGGVLAVVRGTCRGRIGRERLGTGGFGYDPLFVPEAQPADAGAAGRPMTMAELSPAAKDAISHRGAAFRLLLPYLARLAARGGP